MCLTVAIIGAGIIAKEHLKALNSIEELHPIAVADIDENKTNLVNKEFNITGYSDYREMVQKEHPHIVVISLPHFLHKEAAIFCANQGCHILLEKPMALNLSECDDIIQAASLNNIQLMVGHIQHYFQENEAVKRIINGGELGQVVQINETRHMNYFNDDRPHWFLERKKAGGGVIMNLGAHSIDKIQWLLNTRFSKVLANLSFHSSTVGLSSDVEGSGLVYLETKDEVPVTISISGYEVVPMHVTELIFTNGMIKIEFGKGVYVSKDGFYEPIPLPNNLSPFKKQFIELKDAIHGKRKLENSGEYGKSVVNVIQGIYQSHQYKKVIELS